MSDFLFTILLILIVFGVFRRYILYFLLGAVSRKITRDLNRIREQQTGQKSQGGVKQGQAASSGKRTRPFDDGDYVDYEEVKD